MGGSFIPKRALLVLGTFLLSVLLYVDRVCISAAKKPISESLGLSDKEFGWVISAFALGYALCQVPSGLLADRFGPRAILTAVVSFWSLFTGLTAAAWNFASMLVVRFLFGAGEAGAFPGVARAAYSWIPMTERGIVQGINFSGSRLGAAFALPVVAWMVTVFGWRPSFVILAIIGFAWATFWYFWFRNDPTEHPGISDAELKYILEARQQAEPEGSTRPQRLSAKTLLRSGNVWLAMVQYFAGNFTFFFCLSWAHPYLSQHFGLGSVRAGVLAAIPLIFGALGNWVSGALVDRIYRKGHWTISRRLPAIVGLALATGGLMLFVYMDNVYAAVLFLSIAIFGADMTLSPSWAFCIDIGRKNAGAVSGCMNMAGNIGSFSMGLAFPYMKAWTKSAEAYFLLAAALNVVAIIAWMGMRPDKRVEEP